jgi:hypothetical protein
VKKIGIHAADIAVHASTCHIIIYIISYYIISYHPLSNQLSYLNGSLYASIGNDKASTVIHKPATDKPKESAKSPDDALTSLKSEITSH